MAEPRHPPQRVGQGGTDLLSCPSLLAHQGCPEPRSDRLGLGVPRDQQPWVPCSGLTSFFMPGGQLGVARERKEGK